jgi:ABC-type uncharacterized transport system involved in gliding motility auxiliary subunit
LYRIDRFVQNGGHLLFAAEGVGINMTQRTLDARILMDKGILSMVSLYGATIKPSLVLDRSALTIQYETQTPSGMRQINMRRYPLWIGVLAENGNTQQPVTARFNGLDLFWASPIELDPPGTVTAEPLFASTSEAWLETKDFATNPEIGYLMEAEAADTKGAKVLAAVLSGTFRSYFEGLPKPVREGATETLPDMPSRPKEARIIVIGDGDIASALIQRRENLDFMVQAALYLSNDDDIIGIRNRQPQAGRLDKITDEAKRAASMRFSRTVNVGFVPLLVIGAGIILAWRRRRRNG